MSDLIPVTFGLDACPNLATFQAVNKCRRYIIAANNIFGKSYEYTRKYKAFKQAALLQAGHDKTGEGLLKNVDCIK